MSFVKLDSRNVTYAAERKMSIPIFYIRLESDGRDSVIFDFLLAFFFYSSFILSINYNNRRANATSNLEKYLIENMSQHKGHQILHSTFY